MFGKGGRRLKADEISSRDVTGVKILSNQAAGVGHNVTSEMLVKDLVGGDEMVD